METVVVGEVDKIGYLVARVLLKKQIYDVVIHCCIPQILDAIKIYFTEIGIPWDETQINKQGIFVSSDDEIDKEEDFSIVVHNRKSNSNYDRKDREGYVFWLRDLNQEEIDALIIEPEIINLDNMPLHLRNGDIRKMFLRTFMIARKEIDIISPWMNQRVVNDALINLMDKALSRGVKIKIIYGLLPGSDEYNQARSQKSDRVAEKMKNTFGKYGDLFSVERDNIHYKLVLCDDLYKLEGGFNYLSFVGDYSNPDTRKEGSPLGRDIEEIHFLRKEYFKE